MVRFFLFILFSFLLIPAISQKPRDIGLQVVVSDEPDWDVRSLTTTSYSSELNLYFSLKDFLRKIREKGYLSASVDSISGDSIQKTAYLYIGQKFELVSLNTDSVDEEILSKTGFRDKQYLGKPFNPRQINQFFQSALTYLENSGYPFAEIKLDNVAMDNEKIVADVILSKNQFYSIDSIVILGDPLRLHPHYIENIIHIKPHQPFEEKVIRNISQRIRENPFVDEITPYEVVFTDKTCKIVLVLKPRKASTFDGILGIQPQDDNDGVVVTGDVKISLGSVIGQGERLDLRWQRLQDQTQEIHTSLQIPFFFQTPIGFGYSLDIYRRDTTFNNVEQNFTLPFALFNGSQFRGFFNSYKTTLISTQAYENSTEIPPYNDAFNSTYGIGFSGQFVENIYNPYRGWILDIQGAAGKNKIEKNPNLEQVNYDSILLEANILEAKVDFQFFQPVAKSSTVMFRMNGAFKQSENLVDNQLYRVGGMGSIRGFDQQSILASAYSFFTIEYRFLLDEKSRISVFSDFGWYEKNTITDFQTDLPYGVGAGIAFDTSVGMFSLNYALGSQFSTPLNFQTGKIHFGFVNFF